MVATRDLKSLVFTDVRVRVPSLVLILNTGRPGKQLLPSGKRFSGFFCVGGSRSFPTRNRGFLRGKRLKIQSNTFPGLGPL